MNKAPRWLALLTMASFAFAACASSSSSTNAKPGDFYAAMPSLAAVRALLGDNNWWPLPPSFIVPPLMANRMPDVLRYQVAQAYAHVGTAELIEVTFQVLSSSTISSGVMTILTSAQQSPVTSPKLGDQALYTQTAGSGAAPYETDAYVRIGPTVTYVQWLRKDGYMAPTPMSKLAGVAVARVRDVLAGKIHSTPPAPSDQAQLPPPGFNITLLGYARVPTESVVLDLGFSSDPELVTTVLKDGGVKYALYGDYVLNTDTHMEVKVLLMDFGDSVIAGQWLDLLRGSTPLDSSGIFSTYSQTTERYYYAFTSGSKAALMTCQSTGVSEAASRACEEPLGAESAAWKLSLGG